MRNRINFVLLLIAMPFLASAESRFAGFWNWLLNNFIVVLGLIIIISALTALFKLLTEMLAVQRRRQMEESGVVYMDDAPKEGYFSKWYSWFVGLKPIDKESDLELDHEYDGIHELDNSLPPWWLYLFYLTIVIAIGYLYVYEFSDIGLQQDEEYELAMRQAEEAKIAYMANAGSAIDETNVEVLTESGDLAEGKDIFIGNCAACHGQLGEGGIGPNFTDEYWLHGGSIQDIFSVVKYGVPEKGMISWQSQLRPVDMQKVSSYILSLQGTNPPNQKEKQGELYVPTDG